MRKREKKRKLVDKEFSTESIIARGTKIKGTIIGSDSVCIFGQLEGEINSKGLVRINREGRIEGTIKAPFVIIDGELNGKIELSERVELRAECRMVGNINTAKIAIAEGSFFQGEVRTVKKKDKPVVSIDKENIEAQKDKENNQNE